MSERVELELHGREGASVVSAWAMLLSVCAMAAVFFGPMLWRGEVPLLGDLSYLFYPGYVAYRECILRGDLPLWNPYMGCGEPFLADCQRGVLYPPNLLFVLLPTAKALVVWIWFHVVLAGLGAIGLCRAWGVSRSSALLAGVAYAFNAYTITKVEFPPQLAATAWMPIVLAAYVIWLRRRTARRVALLALALCLEFLTGYPEIVVFTVGALTILMIMAIGRAVLAGLGLREALIPMAGLAVGGVMAMALSAAQLLPTVEALGVSARSSASDPMLEVSSVHPMALFSLLIPSVYGVGGWGGVNWAPSCFSPSIGAFYVGLVPVVLLVCAATTIVLPLEVRRHQTGPAGIERLRTPFFLVLGTLFFLYAAGKYTPVFKLCWHAIPLLQRFVWPAKCLLFVTLALSCLGAIALDRLARVGDDQSWRESKTRYLVVRYAPLAVFGVASVFVAVCLVKIQTLGTAVLRWGFNFDRALRLRGGDVPWGSLIQDGVKLIVLAPAVAALVGWYVFRPRRRRLVVWLLALSALADLYAAHAFLLEPGPASILDRPTPLGDVLKTPPSSPRRFLAFEFSLPDQAQQTLETLEEGERLIRLSPEDMVTEDYGRPLFANLLRPWRCILQSSWPMAEGAFNLGSQNNFISERVATLSTSPLWKGTPMDARKRVLGMAHCDRIVLTPNVVPAFGKLGEVEVIVLESIDLLPRAFVVGGLQQFPDEEKAWLALLSGGHDFREVALTDQSAIEGDVDPALRSGRVEHTITEFVDRHSSLEIHVESRRTGVLVVSDAHYPGWRATVNGEWVPILKVNHAFRGVVVPAGRSEVTMTYWPTSLTVGIVISVVSLLVLGVMMMGLPRRPSTTGLTRQAEEGGEAS